MAKNVTFKPSSAKRGARFPKARGGTNVSVAADGGTRVGPAKAPSKGARFPTNPKANP